MPFIRRLGYFLLGLSVGLIFLAIFLRKKSDETGTEFCYLPNCRVLKELRSKPASFTDTNLSMQLDSVSLAKILTEGEVLFDKSEPRAEPCGSYIIEFESASATKYLSLENCQDSIRIISYQP